MRILHTLHWVQFAGTERVCVDLCDEISKQNEVILLSNKNIENYISKNVKFINFDFEKNRRNPFFLYKTAKFIEKIRPDIIHCHNTKELEIMRYMQVFLKKKIPLIAAKHTLEFKKNYKLADLCVAVLDETKKILPPNSIIIENGILYKKPEKIKKLDKFHIISSGRLSAVKQMDVVIKALSLVKFDFVCEIFGQGEKQGELERLISELKLDKKVFLRGFVDNINDHLASCDLQIIASKFEAYGLVAIDGVYYSPLMISTNTGICERILPSELKFSATPENLAHKLDEIHANYDKFVQIFALIKAKKDEFSVAKMAQKYINAYENLIKDFKK
ncbi:MULTISPECIES: glycosyltransferase [unclassified Campylobacter]|uniref:glycosyltransferase n=1 Tax=unclassified Campylobacter TaxID=2593542 RepID=UPI0022EA05FA|nr:MULTISPECIES: glycosyltransferase [unclassified Campylobacter]MDA3053864.1 glycosyltransferase [Campylobacter sp. VBCF_07 NA4]MDA3060247.1 glycosyltransferase [Campylobacter sp. VBCF_02 NA5]MDA3069763.1 glycosyltransferase [Campylobacter sp. VBCF_08 NA3]WBR54907.1 glycosyltransferase [Campylobacter sp. VBCF_01 NA2]